MNVFERLCHACRELSRICALFRGRGGLLLRCCGWIRDVGLQLSGDARVPCFDLMCHSRAKEMTRFFTHFVLWAGTLVAVWQEDTRAKFTVEAAPDDLSRVGMGDASDVVAIPLDKLCF